MKLNRIKPSGAVISLFAALFITAAFFTAKLGKASFDKKIVFSEISTPFYFLTLVISFVSLFIIFILINKEAVNKAVLLTSFMAYGIICMRISNDAFFCLGACLILLFICAYIFKAGSITTRRDISKRALIAISAAAIIYFSVFFGIQTVCRYLTFSTPCFDFGIFSQMFYNMRRSLIPYTTCEREMLLSHFAVHVSPIYYLFLPFYIIFPSPVTLQICQAVMLASGVIPLCLLCRKQGLTRLGTSLFICLYVLYPALGGGTYYDLHENKFLAPLILWLLYFHTKQRRFGTLIFILLVCLVKEDAPVYVIFLSLYFILSANDRKNRLFGVLYLAVSALYFAVVIYLLNEYGLGTMNYRYGNFMAENETSLLSAVVNIIKQPAYAIYEIFNTKTDVSKLEFIIQTLLPLGAMPFITKDAKRLILLCPYVLVNLMPDYVYQHDIFFQYTYGAFPLLLYSAILTYSLMSDRTKRITGTFALCASVLVCTHTVYRRAGYLQTYISRRAEYDEVRQVLSDIPEGASVSATTFFCAALSERDVMYSLNNSAKDHDTDYVAVDMRYSAYSKYYDVYKEDGRYEVIYYKEGYLALFRHK